MAKYEINTEWKFDEPAHEIFDLIREMKTWQEWWKGFENVVKVVHGFEIGQGSLYHCVLKGWLPLKIKFTQVISNVVVNELVEGNVHGDITGFLHWEFSKKNDSTILKCHFKIHDSRPFTHFSSFLLFPLYVLNYNYIFRNGNKGLALRLKQKNLMPL